MAAGKQVAIIGAALDLGAGRRGVDMGPSAIRYAELAERIRSLGRHVIDQGDVRPIRRRFGQNCGRASYIEVRCRPVGELHKGHGIQPAAHECGRSGLVEEVGGGIIRGFAFTRLLVSL